MAAITDDPPEELGGDADAEIRQLYSHYASVLHSYVEPFCPDRASADATRETRLSRRSPVH